MRFSLRFVVAMLRRSDGVADRADWTHFDAAEACRRNYGGNLDRFVEVAGIDQLITAGLFLGFHPRPSVIDILPFRTKSPSGRIDVANARLNSAR